MGCFGPKNGAHPHNPESALRFFLHKFCRLKGSDRYMKILLVVFREQNSFGGNSVFLAFRLFFTVRLGMFKLSQVTVNWILNSQGMISFMITTGSLNNQDMNRILKQ